MSTASPVTRSKASVPKRSTTPNPEALQNGVNDIVEQVKRQTVKTVTSEWDYKLAFAIITLLGFISRFYGIQHPDQVVFDEVHFGKVRLIIKFIQ